LSSSAKAWKTNLSQYLHNIILALETVDKLILPVDNSVDKLWITLWITLWINTFKTSLWISPYFIHSLSTAYSQFSTSLIHKLNSIPMRV